MVWRDDSRTYLWITYIGPRQCTIVSLLFCIQSMKPESVLVVPTSSLWRQVAYSEKGLITSTLDEFGAFVGEHGLFVDRAIAENEPAYKQIVPYAVVRHQESFFLLQRKSAQSEERLHHKFSIGVGGHINPSERNGDNHLIRNGLAREINEELYIAPGYQERLIGLINDDTTDVGRVHLGVLFEITSASPDVRVRETHKMEGAWSPIQGLEETYYRLETWSQIVYDFFLRSTVCRDTTTA
jgi:predicted NUDIX family phosphoesterase